MKTKFLSLAVATALTAGLTGCGGSSDNDANWSPATPTQAEQDAAAKAAAEKAAAEKAAADKAAADAAAAKAAADKAAADAAAAKAAADKAAADKAAQDAANANNNNGNTSGTVPDAPKVEQTGTITTVTQQYVRDAASNFDRIKNTNKTGTTILAGSVSLNEQNPNLTNIVLGQENNVAIGNANAATKTVTPPATGAATQAVVVRYAGNNPNDPDTSTLIQNRDLAGNYTTDNIDRGTLQAVNAAANAGLGANNMATRSTAIGNVTSGDYTTAGVLNVNNAVGTSTTPAATNGQGADTGLVYSYVNQKGKSIFNADTTIPGAANQANTQYIRMFGKNRFETNNALNNSYILPTTVNGNSVLSANSQIQAIKLNDVQYGRVTNNIDPLTAVEENRTVKGFVGTGYEYHDTTAALKGASNSVDTYFARGTNETKDMPTSGTIQYLGHAITYGIDNSYDGKTAVTDVPNAFGQNNDYRTVGNFVEATLDTGKKTLNGNIYNALIPADTAKAVRKVDLIGFSGTVSGNTAAGTSVNNTLSTDNANRTGNFKAAFFGSQAAELAGSVNSIKDYQYTNTAFGDAAWGGVFGAQKVVAPAAPKPVDNNGNYVDVDIKNVTP